MDVNVQFVKIITLFLEWKVVASEHNIQDTVEFVASCYALQPLLQKLVRFGEAGDYLPVV